MGGIIRALFQCCKWHACVCFGQACDFYFCSEVLGSSFFFACPNNCCIAGKLCWRIYMMAATNRTTFSTTDVSAWMTMKCAANCSKRCEFAGFCEPIGLWMYRMLLGWAWKQIGFRMHLYTVLFYVLCRMHLVHMKANSFRCVEASMLKSTLATRYRICTCGIHCIPACPYMLVCCTRHMWSSNSTH